MSTLARSSFLPANSDKTLFRIVISRHQLTFTAPSATARLLGLGRSREPTWYWKTSLTCRVQRLTYRNWSMGASLPDPIKHQTTSSQSYLRRRSKTLDGSSNRKLLMPESIRWWTKNPQMQAKKRQDQISVTCSSRLRPLPRVKLQISHTRPLETWKRKRNQAQHN